MCVRRGCNVGYCRCYYSHTDMWESAPGTCYSFGFANRVCQLGLFIGFAHWVCLSGFHIGIVHCVRYSGLLVGVVRMCSLAFFVGPLVAPPREGTVSSFVAIVVTVVVAPVVGRHASRRSGMRAGAHRLRLLSLLAGRFAGAQACCQPCVG